MFSDAKPHTGAFFIGVGKSRTVETKTAVRPDEYGQTEAVPSATGIRFCVETV